MGSKPEVYQKGKTVTIKVEAGTKVLVKIGDEVIEISEKCIQCKVKSELQAAMERAHEFFKLWKLDSEFAGDGVMRRTILACLDGRINPRKHFTVKQVEKITGGTPWGYATHSCTDIIKDLKLNITMKENGHPFRYPEFVKIIRAAVRTINKNQARDKISK